MAKNKPADLVPKGAYHHGDLPRALVLAATSLIENGEGSRLTLRGAAQAAGVSAAAPYRHFADREALLAAVLAQGFRDLARRCEAARAARSDPIDALVGTGVAYIRFAVDRPRLYPLMFGPECNKASYPDLLDAGQSALGVLHHAVAQCQAADLIECDDIHRVALAGWSLAHGIASLHTDGLLGGSGAADDVDDLSHRFLEMLINGLRKKPLQADKTSRPTKRVPRARGRPLPRAAQDAG